MLSDDVRRVRAEPGPAILTAAVGVLVGVLLGATVFNGDGKAAGPTQRVANGQTVVLTVPTKQKKGDNELPPPASAGTNASSGPFTSPQSKVTVQRALDQAVKRAQGGRLELAVWVEGWSDAAVSPTSARERRSRMWSMSKAVTAVALHEITDANGGLPPAVRAAIDGALRRSENCRQRRVVLELQKRAGSPVRAIGVLQQVLGQAGATASFNAQPQPPDGPSCAEYLRQAGVDPQTPALQLGTSKWSVRDGAAFGLALANGRYLEAGSQVAKIMRSAKGPSRDPGVRPEDYSVDSMGWGAGDAFARFAPAYKAGWGGADRLNYMVGQVVAMDVGGIPVGVMGVFHPSVQPPGGDDDPGKTVGPVQLETAFRSIVPALERLRR